MEENKLKIELAEQKESIKLMRMSKGYQWEIKIFIGDDKATTERLKALDKALRTDYVEGGNDDD